MSRRPDRTTPALLLALLLFVAFGMARVAAPVSGLGLLFHEPAVFAVAAAVTSLAGAALLLVRPVELRRLVAGLGARLGTVGRLLAVPVLVVLVLWQVSVMWLCYVANLFSRRADRLSEFSADRAAASWG
jgi:hypothetical protein